MKNIQRNNYKLNYQQIGDSSKHPILVIGSAIYYPKLFADERYKNLNLIFVDHVGFTNIESEDTSHLLDEVVEDIEAIRKELGIEEMNLLGHSGHGFMAMAYASKYPEHTSGVILSNLAPTNTKERQDGSIEYFETTASIERKEFFYKEIAKLSEDIKREPNKRFSSMNIRMQAHSFYDYKYDGAYLWDDIDNNMPALDYLWGEAFAQFDTEAFIASWNKPIVLLLSDYDYLVSPTSLWDGLINKYGIETIKFDKSGHNPMLEEASKYYEVISKF